MDDVYRWCFQNHDKEKKGAVISLVLHGFVNDVS